MNAGEYGILFQFGTGYDMSANTSVGLVFTKPDGTIVEVLSPSVSVGNVASGAFAAFQYLKYTFVHGDIDQPGTYRVRALYDDGIPTHLISNAGSFVVGP